MTSNSKPGMTSVPGQAGLANLFGNNVNTGVMTQAASNILLGLNSPLMVAGACGVGVDDIPTNDPVTLLTFIVDASGSVEPQWQDVIDGYNGGLDELQGSKQSDTFLVSTWFFGSRIEMLHAHVPLKHVTRLDKNNYKPVQDATALYDAYAQALGATMAYYQQLQADNIAGQMIPVLITDGGHNHSIDRRHPITAAMCVSLNTVPANMVEKFIPAFVGVGEEKEFRGIAKAMGFPDRNVLVENNAQPGAYRRLFRQVSKSALKTSVAAITPGATNISTTYFT